jgi:hypothetical protein
MAAVSDLTPERAVKRPAEGEWSVLEVMAHLVEADRYYMAEALALRDDPDRELVFFDDEAWKASHPDVRDTPWPDVLSAVAETHASVLRDVAQLTPVEFSQPVRHPRGIFYMVSDVLLRLPAHDETHRRQIRQILASI